MWKPEVYLYARWKVDGAADTELSFILGSAFLDETCIGICDLLVLLLPYEFREELP